MYASYQALLLAGAVGVGGGILWHLSFLLVDYVIAVFHCVVSVTHVVCCVFLYNVLLDVFVAQDTISLSEFCAIVGIEK